MKEGNKGERREGKKEEPACLSLLFSLGLINTCLSLMLKSSQSPRILTPRLVHLFLGQLKVYYLGYSHLLFPHPLILSHLISKKKTQMAHLRSINGKEWKPERDKYVYYLVYQQMPRYLLRKGYSFKHWCWDTGYPEMKKVSLPLPHIIQKIT